MRYVALPLLLLLSACSGPLDRLHSLQPSADDYASALAAEYLSYAQSEAEQGHSERADYYATKGLKALDGETVAPEMPDSKLATKDLDMLAAARAQLMKFSNEDIRRVAPQKLARAQLLFDCWQQQVASAAKEEMALCADGFSTAMTELQDVEDGFQYSSESVMPVSFARQSITLDDAAQAVIKGVAAKVAGVRYYRIELQSYTGIKASQKRLTRARLEAVRKALVASGIPKRNINVRKYRSVSAVMLSEDKLAVDTKKIYITIKTHNLDIPVAEPVPDAPEEEVTEE